MKWVSWVQKTEDYRPLKCPPNEGIIDWWCSGSDSEDNAILVAMVIADTDKQAVSIIRKDWPEFEKWRFIDGCNSDPPSNRFPLSKIGKQRLSEFYEETKASASVR